MVWVRQTAIQRAKCCLLLHAFALKSSHQKEHHNRRYSDHSEGASHQLAKKGLHTSCCFTSQSRSGVYSLRGDKCVAGISNHQSETVVFSLLDMECGDFWRVCPQHETSVFSLSHVTCRPLSHLSRAELWGNIEDYWCLELYTSFWPIAFFFLNTTSHTRTNILEKSSTYQTICSLQYRAAQ